MSQLLYGEDLERTENMTALNFVDFYFLPHLNSPYFATRNKETIEQAVAGMKEKVYALDDNSVLAVVHGKVEVISEGEWLEFN